MLFPEGECCHICLRCLIWLPSFVRLCLSLAKNPKKLQKLPEILKNHDKNPKKMANSKKLAKLADMCMELRPPVPWQKAVEIFTPLVRGARSGFSEVGTAVSADLPLVNGRGVYRSIGCCFAHYSTNLATVSS